MNSGKTNHGKLKEIVVLSGKGGTGKTTITSSLADGLKDIMMVDADVEAANWHLLLKPYNIEANDFTGKSIAKIDEEKCTGCGKCLQLCRFDAIKMNVRGDRNTCAVDAIGCDGCGLCQLACPVAAVNMEQQTIGQWFHAETGSGPLTYARLKPGGENSGHLVAMVKKQARSMAEKTYKRTIIIDGPPGIGCPVIAALSGADFALIVTEPTFSGLSDMERIIDLILHFQIPCGVVINRFDINPRNCKKIAKLLTLKNIPLLTCIPHSFDIIREISGGRLPVRNCKTLQKSIGVIHHHLEKRGFEIKPRIK
jgi:MinD superfamily P-loop ATPase